MNKFSKIIKKNYKWIICFVCLIFFLLLAEDVFNKDVMKGDILGYTLIRKYLISKNITSIMKFITWFGSASCLIITSLLLLCLIKNRKVGLSCVINLFIITVFNQLFKFTLQRPRPSKYNIITEKGYSFPSGHSMVSMAFYGYIIYLVYKFIKNKYLKWAIISVLSLLIIFIGISRIYLGVHYTSDVLAGFLISISYLVVYINITKAILDEKES